MIIIIHVDKIVEHYLHRCIFDIATDWILLGQAVCGSKWRFQLYFPYDQICFPFSNWRLEAKTNFQVSDAFVIIYRDSAALHHSKQSSSKHSITSLRTKVQPYETWRLKQLVFAAKLICLKKAHIEYWIFVPLQKRQLYIFHRALNFNWLQKVETRVPSSRHSNFSS